MFRKKDKKGERREGSFSPSESRSKRAPRKKDGETPSYKKPRKFYKKKNAFVPTPHSDGFTRLNKYIANTGVCSRREADDLIRSGVVSVNGKVVTEMGHKIAEGDVVKYNGETLKREKLVYILLNKPKDFITTVEDPQGRKTVLDLVRNVCRERIYPVGRLDRNTTGVLLLTNDGDLTTQLTHPSFGVRKVYHVSLSTGLKSEDLEKIRKGIELEDGMIKPDDISFVEEGNKKEIGIEIHSGKNRIVRRLFEHLGYEVVKLDRVVFAGLTKKDLPRGRSRFLSEKEIAFLKMLPKKQIL